MKNFMLLAILFPLFAFAGTKPMGTSQEQTQMQAASANADANNENNQNLNIATAVEFTGGDINYNSAANTAYAPQPWSQISCSSVFGVGYSNVNGSGSIGLPIPRFLSKKIQDCEKERDASNLAQIGMIPAAIKSLCARRSMQEVHGDDDACAATLISQIPDNSRLAALERQMDQLKKQNAALLDERQHDLDELRDCRDRVNRATETCGQDK